ncbi:MAG: flagellar motor protein MotB [Fimbriimonas sp.]
MSEHTPIIIKKKKVHGGHGHHGGSWKVAYADFVTAMMAFFMVMWIMGLSDDTKSQIQGYFNDPLGFNKTLPRSKSVISIRGVPAMKPGTSREPDGKRHEKDEKELRKVANEVKGQLEKTEGLEKLMKQIEVLVTREGLRIEFVESSHMAFFQSGSSVLRPEARQMVAKIAPVLAKSGREMMVEGHTDAQPYAGKGFTNWDLSSGRALALRQALANGGVRYDQFKAVRGLAETELRDPEHPLSASNRRVSILLPWEKEKAVEEPPKEDISPEAPKIAPSFEPPKDDHH